MKQLIHSALLVSALTTLTLAEVKPLQSVLDSIADTYKVTTSMAPNEVYSFFKDNFTAGGYSYKYPENTSKVLVPEESGKIGEVSVEFKLDADDYSGGAVVLDGVNYDLTPYYANGALEFWIKGSRGGEICNVELADDELVNGVKTEIAVPINNYGGIKPYWTKISIPLADFGTRGEYWDEKKDIGIKRKFDWKHVAEFLITIEKGDNPDFDVFVDNIIIVKDKYPTPADLYAPYWDEVVDTVDNFPSMLPDGIEITQKLFYGDFTDNMKTEAYGGKSAASMQPTNEPSINKEVMAFYLDNSDYSGITLFLDKSYDLTQERNNAGGIGFWAKGIPGVDNVMVALQDDESDGKSVSTAVLLTDFGKLDGKWHYITIPLKEFSSDGAWWDEALKAEKPGTMDWKHINGFTITADKYANRVEPGKPAIFYFDNIAAIKHVPGYVDPDVYWDNFHSNAPDKLIIDFENANPEAWTAESGELSKIQREIADQEDRDLRAKYGRKWLAFEYNLNDWAYVSWNIGRFGTDAQKDWSNYNAITMDVHSDMDTEVLSISIKDAGHEQWFAKFKVKRGWNKVVVPFRKFRKDPYDQEPDAKLDGKLDLSTVNYISFSPLSVGITSKTIIDNVTLTNINDK